MEPTAATLTVSTAGLPVVSFGQLLTFIIRIIFVIAGLAALIYGLLGGMAWITSGGEKEKIQAARDKIQAAFVGIFILILVLTIIWTIEQIIFHGETCFGISCDVKIPSLVRGGSSSSGGNQNPAPGTCEELCVQKGYSGGYCAAPRDNCNPGEIYINPTHERDWIGRYPVN